MDVKTVPGLPYWMGDDDDDGWNDDVKTVPGLPYWMGDEA